MLVRLTCRGVAVILAAVLGAGCGALSDDDGAAPRPTIAPIGRRITVEGTVSRVVSGHVMVVSDPPHEFVVVTADDVPSRLDGATVRAEGRIRQFNTVAMERTLDIELDDDAVADFLGLPCVVATAVDIPSPDQAAGVVTGP